jgi:dipeptidyl-peptidase 4
MPARSRGRRSLQQVLRELDPRGAAVRCSTAMIVLAVPIYNSDGNEAWGPGAAQPSRARTVPTPWACVPNGQGFDLNRDYVKQDAPETRAALAFIAAWDPDLW